MVRLVADGRGILQISDVGPAEEMGRPHKRSIRERMAVHVAEEPDGLIDGEHNGDGVGCPVFRDRHV